MTRTRMLILIDKKIPKAKENFEKAKNRYDAAAKELENLQAKQRMIHRNELIQSVEKTGYPMWKSWHFLKIRSEECEKADDHPVLSRQNMGINTYVINNNKILL